MSQVNAEMYSRVFVGHGEGALVLDHMQEKFFSVPSYVRGGHEADRETAYREGQKSVINWIHLMIDRAQRGEVDDADA